MHSSDKSRSISQPELSHWSARKRAVVGVLVSFHLFAVAVAPLASPPPSSQLFRSIAFLMQPYLQGLYLNHGYRFFAPNPGPGHVIRYEIYDTIVESPKELPDRVGMFPDRDKYWPRQLYHRWFMLSENVYAVNSEIPSEEEFKEYKKTLALDLKNLRDQNEPALADRLEQQMELDILNFDLARQQRTRLLEAIGQDLLRRHNGQRIKLFLRERQLPAMIDIQQGKKLDDQDYFNSDFEWYLGSTTRNKAED